MLVMSFNLALTKKVKKSFTACKDQVALSPWQINICMIFHKNYILKDSLK